MPSGTVIAMPWIGVPLTTPRRTVALFRANDAADRIAKMAPSTSNLDCFAPARGVADAAKLNGGCRLRFARVSSSSSFASALACPAREFRNRSRTASAVCGVHLRKPSPALMPTLPEAPCP